MYTLESSIQVCLGEADAERDFNLVIRPTIKVYQHILTAIVLVLLVL